MLPPHPAGAEQRWVKGRPLQPPSGGRFWPRAWANVIVSDYPHGGDSTVVAAWRSSRRACRAPGGPTGVPVLLVVSRPGTARRPTQGALLRAHKPKPRGALGGPTTRHVVLLTLCSLWMWRAPGRLAAEGSVPMVPTGQGAGWGASRD